MTNKYSSILKLRKWKEDGILNEVGRLNQVLETDKRKLSTLEDHMSDHAQNMGDVLREGSLATLHEVGLYSNYLTHLSGEVRRQEKVVEKRQEEMANKRHQLGEAARDRKVVETLREKAVRAELKDHERHAQREVDDVSAIRHGRR